MRYLKRKRQRQLRIVHPLKTENKYGSMEVWKNESGE
jgi:hypothetical protein